MPPVAPKSLLLTTTSNVCAPTVTGVVLEIVMLTFEPLGINGVKLETDNEGVGSTCTVVTTSVPSVHKPALFNSGVTVNVTVMTDVLLLVNVPVRLSG